LYFLIVVIKNILLRDDNAQAEKSLICVKNNDYRKKLESFDFNPTHINIHMTFLGPLVALPYKEQNLQQPIHLSRYP